MKIWIEGPRCSGGGSCYIWIGTAPEWDENVQCWMKRVSESLSPLQGRYICDDWLRVILPDGCKPPGANELLELDLNYVATWEMR